jgi:hypothetical protein
MRAIVPTACAMIAFPIVACAGQSPFSARNAPDSLGTAHALPADYRPLHKGGIDLATGLYVRENEDLVVPGTPGIILRRTYLSGYRASREFGIGALHNGEEYLIGDGEKFQWASLILARGSRIEFRRTSPGSLLMNAEYVHNFTSTDFNGAKLSWTGLTWVLQKKDGSTMTFKACSSAAHSVCSIIQSRDADGHTIYYRRNLAGALLKMDDGAGRWISFDYDESRRIRRAYASTGRYVRYEYDKGGRLSAAIASDGLEYRYTYTDLDELATIDEPGTSIENSYADGRCIHQVNNYPDGEPLVFDFSYRVEGKRVLRTESRNSAGVYKIYAWDEDRRAASESFGQEGHAPIVFAYERDALTKAISGVTVTCPDFGGGSTQRTSKVGSADAEQVKADLVAQCFAAAIKR